MADATWNDLSDLYPEGDVRNNMISKTARVSISRIARVMSLEKEDLIRLPIFRTYTEEEEDVQKKFFVDHLSQDIPREHAERLVNDIWKSAKNLLSRRDLRDIRSQFLKQ